MAAGVMNDGLLLTFNAGSSSIKIGVFDIEPGQARRMAGGAIDFRRSPARLAFRQGDATVLEAELRAAADDLPAVLAETFDRLGEHLTIGRVAAIGHRVVHGGENFAGPVRLDRTAIEAIAALTRLAPLHQPQNLKLIRATERLWPQVAQSASFDTAFHRTNPDLVRRFAIPRALHDQGIRRYGFHGLSYRYIAGELARRAPSVAAGKVVVAHLGSGASLCALRAGVSQDSSMGFSTLDGIPMATRCGALDPGVLLHLLGPGGRTLAEVEDILYHRSGLLGVSGISADSRVLLASAEPSAREALDLFSLRVAGEIARLAATLGGLDAVVFTAGIGENQPAVRAGIAARLAWLGLQLDDGANAANAGTISAASSRVAALVIPTDEEQVIADEAVSVLRAGG